MSTRVDRPPIYNPEMTQKLALRDLLSTREIKIDIWLFILWDLLKTWQNSCEVIAWALYLRVVAPFAPVNHFESGYELCFT